MLPHTLSEASRLYSRGRAHDAAQLGARHLSRTKKNSETRRLEREAAAAAERPSNVTERPGGAI